MPYTLYRCPLLFLLSQCFRSSLPHVLLLPPCSPSSAAAASLFPLVSFCSPLGVLPSCCPVVSLALSVTGCLLLCCVFVLFSFSHPFLLCCPFLVLLLCCPNVVMFALLSEAVAAHHNNNSCRLSCLGSMLVYFCCYFFGGARPLRRR